MNTGEDVSVRLVVAWARVEGIEASICVGVDLVAPNEG